MSKIFNLSNGRTLSLVQDENAGSPREWDNLSKFIFFGKYRHAGEKHNIDSDPYSNWEENKEAVIKAFKPAVIVPIYMYSHSSETVSLKPFNCQWDSGQLGWVLVTKVDACNEYNVKRMTNKTIETINSVIEAEVNVYDQYITGDTWGYVIRDRNGDEEDSCWGFYGSDIKTNGILDNINDLDKKQILKQI